MFTSILSPSYEQELERLLFLNQNQDKVQSEVPLLIQRYGMAHVRVFQDRLRVVLDSSPEPQTLYVLEPADGPDQLLGVIVYLREGDTLSVVIAAVREDYAGVRIDSEKPLVKKMVDALCDIARRVKGITSVTVFPGTPRERKLSLSHDSS